MNILVTGGAGFIGSHLVDFLIGQGNNVTVIDNIITGRIENLRHHFDNPRFKLIIDTVLNRKTMEELIAVNEHVYNLAAPVGVKFIMNHPVHTLLDNVRGIDVVLELCNKYRRKVLVASTSEVYGRNLEFLNNGANDRLCEESYRVMGSTKNHRWAYANTKALDEFLAFAYMKEFGLPVVIARFFNTIGPRQIGEYGMVVPNFIQSALKNDPIHIYGTGDQTRCFAFIKDVIRAITKLMDTPAAFGEVYNIGGTEEISILDLAKKVVELAGSKSEIRFMDYQTAYGDGFEDMMKRTPDTAKLRKAIGFAPEYSLENMLIEIVEHFRNPVQRAN